ncbi:Uncharacterised protein [uncultured archaeon]|nr:Uncharacterised protein [uncultured archaeon]
MNYAQIPQDSFCLEYKAKCEWHENCPEKENCDGILGSNINSRCMIFIEKVHQEQILASTTIDDVVSASNFPN